MAAKPKFEYLVITRDIPQVNSDIEVTSWLNSLGDLGWELCRAYKHWWQDKDLQQDCWIFKRLK